MEKVRVTIPIKVKAKDGKDGQDGAPGAPGAQGETGLIWRVAEWEAGKVYHNDEDLTAEECHAKYGTYKRYIDVVVYPNEGRTAYGAAYECLETHTSTAANEPAVTGDSKLWKKDNTMAGIIAPFIIAKSAYFEGLTVGGIKMYDTKGNTIFNVSKDDGGNVTIECNKGNFNNIAVNNGTFNNITIQSGNIAGFKVSGDGLTNDPFTNDAYIIFRNDQMGAFAGIGGNVLPATSGARGVARFENHDDTDEWGLGVNYAALVSARGSRDNRALQIDGGAVSGFALKNTVISSSGTVNLTRYDYNVIAINDSDLTLVLPTMQLYDDGHVIRIKRLGNGALKLRMNNCYTYNGSSSRYSRPALIYDQDKTLTGTDTLDVASKCDAMELVWCRDIIRTIGNTSYYGLWIQYKFPRDW